MDQPQTTAVTFHDTKTGKLLAKGVLLDGITFADLAIASNNQRLAFKQGHPTPVVADAGKPPANDGKGKAK